jgi:hypothetical protein
VSYLSQFGLGGGIPIGQVLDLWPRYGNAALASTITYRGMEFVRLDMVRKLAKASYPDLHALLGDGWDTPSLVTAVTPGTSTTSFGVFHNGTRYFMPYSTSIPNYYCVYSSDAVTWNACTWSGSFLAQKAGVVNGVSWIGGTTGNFATSADGITFTNRSLSGSGTIRDVAYGGGVYVAVGRDGASNDVFSSTDLATWTGRSTVDFDFVAYGASKFVAVQANTSVAIYTSTDGSSWTSRTPWSGTLYGHPISLHWTGSRFVCGLYGKTVDNDRYYAVSDDGITWTIEVGTFDCPWNDSPSSTTRMSTVFSYDSKVWGVIPSSGATLMASSDYVNWEKAPSLAYTGVNGVNALLRNGVVVCPTAPANAIGIVSWPRVTDTVVLRKQTGTVSPYQYMRVK